MKLLSLLCPPINTLILDTPTIGPGLFIQHGVSTCPSAESVGSNLHINQQVTVGYSNPTDRPTIGANAVVFSDVPPDVTVFGVPAQIVWRARPRPNHLSRQEVLT